MDSEGEHAMTGGPRHRTSTEASIPTLQNRYPTATPHHHHQPTPSTPGSTWYPRLAAGSLLVFFLLTLSNHLHPTPWRSSKGIIGSPRHDWPPDPVPPSSRPGSHSPPVLGCRDSAREMLFPRQKAALLLLARDSDLDALLPTLENFESKFNQRFKYPYVFLNDVPFSASFVMRIRAALEGREVEFGTIDKADWSIPDWVDETEARDAFARMGREGVQYADRESYHHMCRSVLIPPFPAIADAWTQVLLWSVCDPSAPGKVRLVLAPRTGRRVAPSPLSRTLLLTRRAQCGTTATSPMTPSASSPNATWSTASSSPSSRRPTRYPPSSAPCAPSRPFLQTR